MTREEAIRKTLDTVLWTRNASDDNKNILTDALIKALEQEPRWIPVSERLPNERIAVLVWCPERKNIYCACYEKKQWWIFGAYFEKVTLEVIAWMPLPSSYSEVEE